ncbi:MAG TPA: VWA domain-containing protein, partial [Gemmataceae bacterium]|nr:VWA domain-containing protein [Gemmataceae bacterium]
GDFLGFLPEGLRRTVETSLGVPPPAPGEGTRWRLEFMPYLMDGLTDPWLAGALAIGAAILVVLIYLREGRTTRPTFKLLLAGLRFCLVLVVLAVLLPQLRLWFERQGWPDVAIVFDDSQSMSTVDTYRDEAVQKRVAELQRLAGLPTADRLRLAQALATRGNADWLDALLTRQQMKVHVYHCSGLAARLADITDPNDSQSRTDALEKIRALKPQGDRSRLGAAVRLVLNDFRGSSLSAIIMCTDGVTTEGEDLAKVAHYAAQSGVPLFFVGIGDQHEPRDLKLTDLQAEDSVYVNDRLVFDVRLTGQGYTNLTVPVTLQEKGKDKVLDQQMVKVDPNGKPVKVRLVHRPTEPGQKTYVIKVPVQPDELKPADNNTMEHTVFVRETKLIKVLYVEGYARYEYRFLKNLLERESAQDPRNKSIDLKVLLLDASDDYAREDRSAIVEFPSKVELNQFDVLILGDVDPTDPKVAPHWKDVADFVRERGGGLLLIAGDRDNPYSYRQMPLADVLPIEVVRGEAPTDQERVEGYRPQLTAVGRFHPIFRFEPDEAGNSRAWNHLAELYWWADGYRAKWGAEVLAVHPRVRAPKADRAGATNVTPVAQTNGGLYPLIVQQFVGSGRTMFFGIDETWRWRFREDELHYNQFWIQTVRYLSRNRQGRVRLMLDRQVPYRRGEPIKITVRFPDDAPPPDAKTEVKVVAERTGHLPGGQTAHETR